MMAFLVFYKNRELKSAVRESIVKNVIEILDIGFFIEKLAA
jgi:hypothetical protein